MPCGYQCHEIGGPWIAENPDCPVHGREGVARREEEEAQMAEVNRLIEALQDKVHSLTERLESAEDRIRELQDHNQLGKNW
jgi:hypothetical protein